MTIGGWILGVFLSILIILGAVGIGFECCGTKGKIIAAIIAVILIIGVFLGLSWYFNNTAAGQRALVDQKSNLSNGLERTVTVYTADGDIIAQYTGQIDIEGNDGGYVVFDFEGHRYMYYNCFVESVAEID